MGDLMGDLATICSRDDTRPAGVRLKALLPWFTRAAIISSNLRLPWYPNDLATCSDLLLHLVVSTVFAEKGLRALGKECVLQLAILSCTIASGAFILDAIQMSDLRRMDDLAQPLLITTARTPAMIEIREALSKTFVIDILTQVSCTSLFLNTGVDKHLVLASSAWEPRSQIKSKSSESLVKSRRTDKRSF